MKKKEKVTRLIPEMAAWLENESRKTGLSESAVLAQALNFYKASTEK